MKGIIGRGGASTWYKTPTGQSRARNKKINSPINYLISCKEPITDSWFYPEIVPRSLTWMPRAIFNKEHCIGDYSLQTLDSYQHYGNDTLFHNYEDGTLEIYMYMKRAGRYHHYGIFGTDTNYNDISTVKIWIRASTPSLYPEVFVHATYKKQGQTASQNFYLTPYVVLLDDSAPFYHIALTVHQQHLTLWVNGVNVMEGDVPSDRVDETSPLAETVHKVNYISSYRDDLYPDVNVLCGYRATHGIALYTEPFTPNFLPFTRKAVGMYEDS